MIGMLLAAALATTSVAQPATANGADRAILCAATNAVLAAMLESGQPTAADRADAALFRQRQAAWLAQVQDGGAARALAQETQSLTARIVASGQADAAQTLLESRLADCPDAGALAAGEATASDPGANAA